MDELTDILLNLGLNRSNLYTQLNIDGLDRTLIYCDGSCNWKSRIGGFGVLMVNKQGCLYISDGAYENTTIGRMELMAMISALKLSNPNNPTIIYSDSEYVTNCVNKNWLENWSMIKYMGCKNQDLLPIYHNLYSKYTDLIVKHVRGHRGILGNEVADQLAKLGYRRIINPITSFEI